MPSSTASLPYRQLARISADTPTDRAMWGWLTVLALVTVRTTGEERYPLPLTHVQ